MTISLPSVRVYFSILGLMEEFILKDLVQFNLYSVGSHESSIDNVCEPRTASLNLVFGKVEDSVDKCPPGCLLCENNYCLECSAGTILNFKDDSQCEC